MIKLIHSWTEKAMNEITRDALDRLKMHQSLESKFSKKKNIVLIFTHSSINSILRV